MRIILYKISRINYQLSFVNNLLIEVDKIVSINVSELSTFDTENVLTDDKFSRCFNYSRIRIRKKMFLLHVEHFE